MEALDAELYPPPSESLRIDGVPAGSVTEHVLSESKIFPGFEHRWWLYSPAGIDPATPLPATVFLDGEVFVDASGPFRSATVLDNLIAAGEIPPMQGIFVDAGTRPSGTALDDDNRSIEYEEQSARNADFLLTELLPAAADIAAFATGPGALTIAGVSSGGMAAFTAAWFRPDAFGRVFSALGSFLSSPDGTGYPELVADSPMKSLRLFFQDGRRDRSHPMFGYGEERHAALVEALAAKGYDFTYELGDGTHDFAHAAALLPEAMRWLWQKSLDSESALAAVRRAANDILNADELADASVSMDSLQILVTVHGEELRLWHDPKESASELYVRARSDLQDFVAESRFGWGQLRE
jgi:enterochelin esterase-like enzyme